MKLSERNWNNAGLDAFGLIVPVKSCRYSLNSINAQLNWNWMKIELMTSLIKFEFISFNGINEFEACGNDFGNFQKFILINAHSFL